MYYLHPPFNLHIVPNLHKLYLNPVFDVNTIQFGPGKFSLYISLSLKVTCHDSLVLANDSSNQFGLSFAQKRIVWPIVPYAFKRQVLMSMTLAVILERRPCHLRHNILFLYKRPSKMQGLRSKSFKLHNNRYHCDEQ